MQPLHDYLESFGKGNRDKWVWTHVFLIKEVDELLEREGYFAIDMKDWFPTLKNGVMSEDYNLWYKVNTWLEANMARDSWMSLKKIHFTSASHAVMFRLSFDTEA